jgi:hypothetical protein
MQAAFKMVKHGQAQTTSRKSTASFWSTVAVRTDTPSSGTNSWNSERASWPADTAEARQRTRRSHTLSARLRWVLADSHLGAQPPAPSRGSRAGPKHSETGVSDHPSQKTGHRQDAAGVRDPRTQHPEAQQLHRLQHLGQMRVRASPAAAAPQRSTLGSARRGAWGVGRGAWGVGRVARGVGSPPHSILIHKLAQGRRGVFAERIILARDQVQSA